MTQRDDDDRDGATQGDGRKPKIEAEIGETRAAIGDDLKALGDRLSPDALREGARGIMHDAKLEAKDLIREVKEEAVGSLRDAKDGAVASLRSAKDSAMETVTEVAEEIEERAKAAGEMTATFVVQNAIPLALIGVGVGWLTLGMRRSASYPAKPRATMGASTPYPSQGRARSGSSLIERAGEEIRDTAHDARERAMDLTHRATDRGREITEEVREQATSLKRRTVDVSHESPLALGALVVAAGIGVGLALPASPMETRLVGEVGGELISEAKRAARHLGETATATAKSIGTSVSQNI